MKKIFFVSGLILAVLLSAFAVKGERSRDDDVPPLVIQFAVNEYSFVLNQDELADEMTFQVNAANMFIGRCMLHGSGEAELEGTYTATESRDSVRYVINGVARIHVVAEQERRFERKITNAILVIAKRGGKFYGTINIPPCIGFKNREMQAK